MKPFLWITLGVLLVLSEGRAADPVVKITEATHAGSAHAVVTVSTLNDAGDALVDMEFKISSSVGGIGAPAFSAGTLTVTSGLVPTLYGELASGPEGDSEIPDGIADAWEKRYGIMVFNPSADSDHDGLSDLLEAAFNLDPHTADAGEAVQESVVEIDGVKYLQIVYRVATSHPGVEVRPELSTHLDSGVWSTEGLSEVSREQIDSETVRVTVRATTPMNQATRQFLRIRSVYTSGGL